MTARNAFARVLKIARKLPDVEEGTTHDQPALKTGGKVFAWMPNKKDIDPDTLAIRMAIIERDVLISAKPDVFYITPHYRDFPSVLIRMNKLSDADLRELLASAHAYMRTARKR